MGRSKNNDIEALLAVREYFDKAKLPAILHGSTLLGIYRDGDPQGSVELAFRDEDFTDEMFEIIKLIPNFVVNESTFRDVGYFSCDYQPGHMEMHPIYYYKDWAFSNLTGMNLLVWYKDMYTKLKKIEWKNKNWYIPSDTEKWLEMMYGKEWRTPQHWGWNQCPNLVDVDKIECRTTRILRDDFFKRAILRSEVFK